MLEFRFDTKCHVVCVFIERFSSVAWAGTLLMVGIYSFWKAFRIWSCNTSFNTFVPTTSQEYQITSAAFLIALCICVRHKISCINTVYFLQTIFATTLKSLEQFPMPQWRLIQRRDDLKDLDLLCLRILRQWIRWHICGVGTKERRWSATGSQKFTTKYVVL